MSVDNLTTYKMKFDPMFEQHKYKSGILFHQENFIEKRHKKIMITK